MKLLRSIKKSRVIDTRRILGKFIILVSTIIEYVAKELLPEDQRIIFLYIRKNRKLYADRHELVTIYI